MDQVFVHALEAGGFAPDALLVAVFVLVCHFGVERGKKQVLQNGAVVVALRAVLVGRHLEQLAQRGFVKQLGGHQALFFQKPDKDQPGQQANQGDGGAAAGGRVVGVVKRLAFGKLDAGVFANRPVIPLGQVFVEAVIQRLDIEHLEPGCVQLFKAGRNVFGVHLGQRHALQNAQVGGVGLLQVNVLDEGHLAFNHVQRAVAFVGAAVNHGNRQQRRTVFAGIAKQQNRWHGKKAVDFACQRGQLAAAPGAGF